MELLRKERQVITVKRKHVASSKENSAMYANIKAVSIKDVFGCRTKDLKGREN